jgi:putative transposase
LTEIDTAGEPVEQDGPAQPGLDVQLAQELIEKARRAGISLVGPDGLLAGVTRTVLQTALDAEMTEHLGFEKGPHGVEHELHHS